MKSLELNTYPVVEEQADGRWVAWYPEHRVRYYGSTRDEATAQLPVRKVVPAPPKTEELDDGSWRAWHSELPCESTGATPEEALENWKQTQVHKLRTDVEYVALHLRLRENPPPSWSVEFISREEAHSFLETMADQPERVVKERGVYGEDGWAPLELSE